MPLWLIHTTRTHISVWTQLVHLYNLRILKDWLRNRLISKTNRSRATTIRTTKGLKRRCNSFKHTSNTLRDWKSRLKHTRRVELNHDQLIPMIELFKTLWLPHTTRTKAHGQQVHLGLFLIDSSNPIIIISMITLIPWDQWTEIKEDLMHQDPCMPIVRPIILLQCLQPSHQVSQEECL